MLTFTIGPFVVSLGHVLILLAYLAGWLASRLLDRSGDASGRLLNLLLIALVVARAAFVVRHWSDYQADTWQIIDIRDGGFLAWPGITAAVLVALIGSWQRPGPTIALGVGMVCGLLVWQVGSTALSHMQRSSTVPAVSLTDLNGRTVDLADYQGRPLVINLWATWCPPCRREMPVLRQAQEAHPQIGFLFVNQAEDAASVRQFLSRSGLVLDNVLLDSSSQLGRDAGSGALPTTLFYNGDGARQAVHLGELSQASLNAYLDRL